MIVQPPKAELKDDGWYITVEQLTARYKYGPFKQEELPCEMTVHPPEWYTPPDPNIFTNKQVIIGMILYFILCGGACFGALWLLGVFQCQL